MNKNINFKKIYSTIIGNAFIYLKKIYKTFFGATTFLNTHTNYINNSLLLKNMKRVHSKIITTNSQIRNYSVHSTNLDNQLEDLHLTKYDYSVTNDLLNKFKEYNNTNDNKEVNMIKLLNEIENKSKFPYSYDNMLVNCSKFIELDDPINVFNE